jgi:hypothetical protein
MYPYGRGGAEDEKRRVTLSLSKYVKHLLYYYDHRFESNHSFIFVTFNILQRRIACFKARLLVSRPFFTEDSAQINQVTSTEMKEALQQISSNSFQAEGSVRVKSLIKQIRTVAGDVPGSNQGRAVMRIELHSMIFYAGIPNIFLTINPADLHHPLAMYFAGVNLDLE